MSQPNEIKLGLTGQEIILPAEGREYSEGWIDISREDRTASGRLVKDIITKKKKFTLDYSGLKKTDLDTIESLYSLDSELKLIVSYENGSPKTFTVHLKPYDQTRILCVAGGLWGPVAVEMEQV